MIKLIAIDMDGTLLNQKKQLMQPQIDAIHAAIKKGVEVVLCTGRCLTGVLPYFEQLGLKDHGFAILNNGCSIHQTSDWQLIDYVNLSNDDLDALNAIRKQIEPIQLSLFDEIHFYILEDEPNALVHEDAKLVFMAPEKITLDAAKMNASPIFESMFIGTKEQLDTFELTYGDNLKQNYSCVRSQDYLYEVMPFGSNKASGLAKLAKKLGITEDEIMAIGDGNNDIEMLQYATYSVAMGNATDVVKAAASYVTDTNENDGVAKAIERFVLNQ